MRVLVVDVGGSNVKLLATGEPEPRKFESGDGLTPGRLVAGVREAAAGWDYEAVALGLPCRVGPDGPADEPGNLGDGWVGYDYEAAFGVPVRAINDAAMQALGAYREGRMLFLGLGTGLGSALVVDRVVVPLELGSLPHAGGTLAEGLGKAGLAERGAAAWNRTLRDAVWVLKGVFLADEVVLGGGQAEEVDPLPEGCRRGGNEDALAGGFRLWEEEFEHHDRRPSRVWRVLR